MASSFVPEPDPAAALDRSPTYPACPSCGSDRINCVGDLAPGVRFAGQPLDAPLPGGTLYACTACHLSFRHPVHPKEYLDNLYRAGNPEFWQYAPANRRDWAITRRWLRQQRITGSILDIGCFDGTFFDFLGEGWDGFGIEMNEVAARRAAERGVTLIGEDVAMLAKTSRQFDVVVAFDLIEHMQDPRALLEQMAARTQPGGVVIIGTGNTEAPSWRLMGSRYWYCALPEHLAFINEAWCHHTAEALGLALVFVTRFSHAGSRTPMQVTSEFAKNLLFRFFPRLFQALRARGFGGIDVARHAAWKQVPPGWLTAKDHVLAIFRNP